MTRLNFSLGQEKIKEDTDQIERVSGSPARFDAALAARPASTAHRRRGRPSHPSLEDIEIVDRLSRGLPPDADLSVEYIDVIGGLIATGIPARVDTRSVLREVRRDLLEGAEPETFLCCDAARILDEAARREEVARARGAVGARARYTDDGQLRARPRRAVVREVCEKLNLEPPDHDEALWKMLARARARRRKGRSIPDCE